MKKKKHILARISSETGKQKNTNLCRGEIDHGKMLREKGLEYLKEKSGSNLTFLIWLFDPFMNVRVTMATLHPLRKTPACIYTYWKYWLKMAQQYGWLVLKANTELYLAQWLFSHLASSEAYTQRWSVSCCQDSRSSADECISVTEFGPIVVKSYVGAGFVWKSTLSSGYCARSPITEMALVEIFEETNIDCTMVTGTFITIFNGLKDQWKPVDYSRSLYFSSEIVIHR